LNLQVGLAPFGLRYRRASSIDGHEIRMVIGGIVKKILLTLALFGVLQTLSAQSNTPPENTPAMSQHYGHGTPPISPLVDMEHQPFQIGSLRGHWTLIYFWADWCEPCVAKGIPELIDFTKTHQAERNSFRIVAVRFGSTHENFEWKDFRSRTLRLEQTVWRQVPPFPVVDDDSSRFSTDWGIHALPTSALIDPKGNLVPNGSLSTLEAKLTGQR
jgi:thiol-disulfide isomerase/thioredoxin